MAFDYNFVTEPDDSLKCLICLEVATDPQQHEKCGKLFCNLCIKKNGKKPCPNCRAPNPQYFKDTRSLRETKALLVKCDNVERGCVWQGRVETLGNHVANCGYTLISCPSKCKAESKLVLLMRKDLGEHLKTKCPNRNYQCQYCQKKGTYASITKAHDSVCIRKIVSCPNTKCTSTMERRLAKRHLQMSCSYTVVACKYASIGCSVTTTRLDMKQHEEESKSHLPLTVMKIEMLDMTLSSSKNEIASLKKTISSLVSDMSSLKAATSLQKATVSSLEDTTCSLVDIVSFHEGTTSSQKSSISSLVDITSVLKEDVYNLSKQKCSTFDLPKYSKMKENDETIYSESFYSNFGGYRMCIRVHPRGTSDECTHVSVFSQLLEGPYDDDLPWPFLGTVVVELLNQLADAHHHTKVIPFNFTHNTHAGSAWGYDKFISHGKLSYDSASNTQYLMNDTLYFRVTVEVDNYKPWLDCTHHSK